ncbi:MAG: 30S ribosomal protein S17 [Candidatus Peribacteraceae bacterium]|nr:30S ribosomal protein S17 [Candidatus Peribacteraceae bacterium]
MRTKVGTITAAKMTDTVTVTVHRSVFHPLYRKRFRVSKKFLADTKGVTDLGVGDTVEITECRPLSKRKCFKVSNVIKRAPRVSDMAEESAIEGVMRHRNKSSENKEDATDTSSAQS